MALVKGQDASLSLFSHLSLSRHPPTVPIHKIPPEILTMIFDACICAWWELSDTIEIVRLSHVCHQWRAVILSHATFWTELFSRFCFRNTDGDYELAKELLLRASSNSSRPLIHLSVSNQTSRFWDLLAPYMSRIESISAGVDEYEELSALHDFLSRSLPQLTSLEMNHKGSTAYFNDLTKLPPLTGTNLPTLRYLNVDVRYFIAVAAVRTLENLVIFDECTAPKALRAALAKCPSLSRISTWGLMVDSTPEERAACATPLALPNLVEVSCSGGTQDTSGFLLPQLPAPAFSFTCQEEMKLDTILEYAPEDWHLPGFRTDPKINLVHIELGPLVLTADVVISAFTEADHRRPVFKTTYSEGNIEEYADAILSIFANLPDTAKTLSVRMVDIPEFSPDVAGSFLPWEAIFETTPSFRILKLAVPAGLAIRGLVAQEFLNHVARRADAHCAEEETKTFKLYWDLEGESAESPLYEIEQSLGTLAPLLAASPKRPNVKLDLVLTVTAQNEAFGRCLKAVLTKEWLHRVAGDAQEISVCKRLEQVTLGPSSVTVLVDAGGRQDSVMLKAAA